MTSNGLARFAPAMRLSAAILAVVGTRVALAANVTLTGDDAINTSSFNTAGHWSDGFAPSSSNTYSDSGHLLRTPSGAGDASFAGGLLTLDTGATVFLKGSSLANTVSFNNGLTLNNASIQNQLAATVVTLATTGSAWTLGSGGMSFAFTNNAGTGIIVSAPLTGSGAITDINGGGSAGAGNAVTLSANNTFTGGVTLGKTNAAVLNINSAGTDATNSALGTGALTIYSGTLDNTSSSALTLATNNSVTINGDFTFNGTKALNLGTGNVSLGASAGTTRTITANGTGALAIGGVIANGATANSIAQAGTGTLILSGANTYSGSTTVAAGTLQFAQKAALYGGTSSNWNTSNIIVQSGGTLAVNVGGAGQFASADLDALKALGDATGGFASGSSLGIDTTNNSGTFTYSSAIANPNGGANALGITKLGTGTLLLSNTANSFSGPIAVNAGALQVTASGQLGASSGVTLTNTTVVGGSGTTLDLNGTATYTGVPLIMNTSSVGGSYRTALNASAGSPIWGASIEVNGTDLAQFQPGSGATLTINGNISAGTGGFSGTLFFRGAGNGVLNGTVNAPNGAFSKTDNGTWTVNSTGNIWKSSTVAVGTVKIGHDDALATSASLQMGQGDASSPIFDLNNHNQTIAGLTVNAGAGGTKTVTNSGASLVTLTINSASSTTYGSATTSNNLITGKLNITKSGTGSFTLSGTGTNTYAGTLSILGGTFALGTDNRLPDASPMVLGGGTFATGGHNETTGALSLTSSSTIDFGTGASVLKYAASNALAWSGTLTVSNWSGDPTNGNGTDALFFGSSSAGLSSSQLASIDFTGYSPGGRILSTGEVVPAPEPGTLLLAPAAMVFGLLGRRRRKQIEAR